MTCSLTALHYDKEINREPTYPVPPTLLPYFLKHSCNRDLDVFLPTL